MVKPKQHRQSQRVLYQTGRRRLQRLAKRHAGERQVFGLVGLGPRLSEPRRQEAERPLVGQRVGELDFEDLAPLGRLQPDETEDLAIARVPFGEAMEAATSGLIKDALTVAMLLRLHHMAAKGELTGGLARLVLG